MVYCTCTVSVHVVADCGVRVKTMNKGERRDGKMMAHFYFV